MGSELFLESVENFLWAILRHVLGYITWTGEPSIRESRWTRWTDNRIESLLIAIITSSTVLAVS